MMLKRFLSDMYLRLLGKDINCRNSPFCWIFSEQKKQLFWAPVIQLRALSDGGRCLHETKSIGGGEFGRNEVILWFCQFAEI